MAHGKNKPAGFDRVGRITKSDAPEPALSDIFKLGRAPTASELRDYYRDLNRVNAAGEVVKIQGAVTNYGSLWKNAADAEAWGKLLRGG